MYLLCVGRVENYHSPLECSLRKFVQNKKKVHNSALNGVNVRTFISIKNVQYVQADIVINVVQRVARRAWWFYDIKTKIKINKRTTPPSSWRVIIWNNNAICTWLLLFMIYSILATFLLLLTIFNRSIFSKHYSRFKHIT